MFVARDAKGNLVNALEKDVTKQDYTCPACGVEPGEWPPQLGRSSAGCW